MGKDLSFFQDALQSFVALTAQQADEDAIGGLDDVADLFPAVAFFLALQPGFFEPGSVVVMDGNGVFGAAHQAGTLIFGAEILGGVDRQAGKGLGLGAVSLQALGRQQIGCRERSLPPRYCWRLYGTCV